MPGKSQTLRVLDWVSVGLLAVATGMVFFYAPEEVTMGLVQKVFYFHVATAWVGMLGFGVALVAGILYLRTSDAKWDRVELAAVEVAIVFLLITIIVGSIWARPIWNTWWTWDPRLTTVTVMELVYAAYLMLRAGIEDPDRRARFGAVYTIIGFLSVPLTFLSIRIFRTIHPVVIGSADPTATGEFDMTAKMLQTFLFSLFAFSVIFVDLIWHRIRLGRLADVVEQMKLRMSA
jgi:heme exporter protein C